MPVSPDSEITCANCGQHLDATDKFCRACGLPTPRGVRPHAPDLTPDTGELRRALDAVPDPQPFARVEPEPVEPELGGEAEAEPTTGSVVRATSPTFAFQLASSTAVMVAIIAVLAIVGVAFLVLAFWP
jgi:hypothetical protein